MVVYILKGTSGRYYYGITNNLNQRIEAHNRGNTATTKRLGLPVELVAHSPDLSAADARLLERKIKRWKNPSKAIAYLSSLE